MQCDYYSALSLKLLFSVIRIAYFLPKIFHFGDLHAKN